MPQIIISEKDLTTSGATISPDEVVFIPGFGNSAFDVPKLYTSVADFQNDVGFLPQTFSSAQEYPTTYFTAGTDFLSTDKLIATNGPDPSYNLAIQLLTAGLPVLYWSIGSSTGSGAKTVANLYTALAATSAGCLCDKLKDVDAYDIKFLTTGGYPSFGAASAVIAQNFASVAATRCDCVALIDAADYAARPLTGVGSVWAQLAPSGDTAAPLNENGDRASMFLTWWKDDSYTYTYTPQGGAASSVSVNDPHVPGSYKYLRSYANMIRKYASGLACAGVTRGTVVGGKEPLTTQVLSNSVANIMQPTNGKSSINCITNIKPYGYCIQGNRTCKNNTAANGLTATSILNLRNISNDIASVARKACRKLTFEQNNDILWVNFKSMITPTLEKLKANFCIKRYTIVKDPTVTAKAKLGAIIQIVPIEPVEDFEIGIHLVDDTANITEG